MVGAREVVADERSADCARLMACSMVEDVCLDRLLRSVDVIVCLLQANKLSSQPSSTRRGTSWRGRVGGGEGGVTPRRSRVCPGQVLTQATV